MKDKIILCEFCPLIGHKMLLDKTYSILSKKYDVNAFAPLSVKETEYIKLKCDYYYSNHTNWLLYNIIFLKYVFLIVRQVLDYAKEKKIKKIVCLTYDDISMFFISFFIPKEIELYLMHHHNVDSMANSFIKRSLFKTYSSRFGHIVLSDFIKKFFCEKLHVNPKIVLVWPHPSYGFLQHDVERNIDCVGLSSSNDDALIGKIIENEKKTGLIKANKLHVYLKSKSYNYDNGYLKVFTGFLEREVYEDYIQRTRSIFVAFPLDFKYRMSATVMDALCNNKVLIGTRIPIVLECQKKYPKIVYLYNEKTFVHDMLGLKENMPDLSYFTEFQRMHSDEVLADIYSESLH